MKPKNKVELWNKGLEDEQIIVTLKCGHTERFWLLGLSNKEYIRRTEFLKKREKLVAETICEIELDRLIEEYY